MMKFEEQLNKILGNVITEALEDPNEPMGDNDPSFADIVNSGNNLHKAIQNKLDEINRHAAENPDEPRAAGWASVEAVREIIRDPFRVTHVDLEDRDSGYVLISGRGNTDIRVPFSANEKLSDWINYTLPEAVPSAEATARYAT